GEGDMDFIGDRLPAILQFAAEGAGAPAFRPPLAKVWEAGQLEPGWPLTSHAEGALQREASLPHGALVKELSDQGDAVGHSSRRRELRQRMRGIGRPVAARFG